MTSVITQEFIRKKLSLDKKSTKSIFLETKVLSLSRFRTFFLESCCFGHSRSITERGQPGWQYNRLSVKESSVVYVLFLLQYPSVKVWLFLFCHEETNSGGVGGRWEFNKTGEFKNGHESPSEVSNDCVGFSKEITLTE